jgi:MbtH protein
MEAMSYVVVRNHEGQYSIWDSERQVPAGWEVQAPAATKEACLEYIRQHWVDMTPLSLRRHADSH